MTFLIHTSAMNAHHQQNVPLLQCGAPFPSDFSCPAFMACKSLSPDHSAALCCPRGQDCSSLNPIACDNGSRNATSGAWTDFLSSTPMSLKSCGTACCPPTYACQDNHCVLDSSLKIAAVAGSNAQTTNARPSTSSAATRPSWTHPVSTRETKTTVRSHFSTNTPAVNDPSGAHQAHAGASRDSPSSGNGLSTTTKALIGVLTALVLLVVFSLLCWGVYKRKKRNSYDSLPEAKLRDSEIREARLRDIELLCKKAELDGIPRVLLVPPREMDTASEPKEIATARPKRPRTLNSVRQELEVDSPTVATTLWI